MAFTGSGAIVGESQHTSQSHIGTQGVRRLMLIHIVIPARYASSRLPGKPLADIAGEAMVVRVARQAGKAAVDSVVVAVDDSRVADAVRDAGIAVQMTRADHISGSDRVMEVAEKYGWSDDDVVINVQGDEPLVPPTVIEQL